MLLRRNFLSAFLPFQTRVDQAQTRVIHSNFAPIVEVPNKVDKLNYNLTGIPVRPFFQLFLNGLILTEIKDFTISSNRIVLNPYYNALTEDNNLVCYYIKNT